MAKKTARQIESECQWRRDDAAKRAEVIQKIADANADRLASEGRSSFAARVAASYRKVAAGELR